MGVVDLTAYTAPNFEGIGTAVCLNYVRVLDVQLSVQGLAGETIVPRTWELDAFLNVFENSHIAFDIRGSSFYGILSLDDISNPDPNTILIYSVP